MGMVASSKVMPSRETELIEVTSGEGEKVVEVEAVDSSC